tara:strand:- start:24 stop:320 length:297 start_codon:yes stop_codon:yes gene_type:complete
MVATTGRIKAGTFVGPELEHYTTSAFNFLNPATCWAFFGIINQSHDGGPADWPAGEIALIGELKALGNPVRFALVAGSGWPAASLTTALGVAITDYTY